MNFGYDCAVPENIHIYPPHGWSLEILIREGGGGGTKWMVIGSHDWAAQLPYKVPVVFDRQKSISSAFCILCCVAVRRMVR